MSISPGKKNLAWTVLNEHTVLELSTFFDKLLLPHPLRLHLIVRACQCRQGISRALHDGQIFRHCFFGVSCCLQFLRLGEWPAAKPCCYTSWWPNFQDTFFFVGITVTVKSIAAVSPRYWVLLINTCKNCLSLHHHPLNIHVSLDWSLQNSSKSDTLKPVTFCIAASMWAMEGWSSSRWDPETFWDPYSWKVWNKHLLKKMCNTIDGNQKSGEA